MQRAKKVLRIQILYIRRFYFFNPESQNVEVKLVKSKKRLVTLFTLNIG